MTTAATCFVVIYRFFNVDRGLVRKALHGGLIQSMFALAPWMEAMTSIQPSFLHDINDILHQQIAGELVYPKTIALLARCVKELSAEERSHAEKSDLFHSRWTLLEKTLIERLVTLRIHSYFWRVSSCNTVSLYLYNVQHHSSLPSVQETASQLFSQMLRKLSASSILLGRMPTNSMDRIES